MPHEARREPILRILVVGTGPRGVVRQQGIGSWERVDAIVLESNGRIAVITKEAAGDEATLAGLSEA